MRKIYFADYYSFSILNQNRKNVHVFVGKVQRISRGMYFLLRDIFNE